MDDEVESLLIDVRASTQGFAQDVATMRAAFDTTLVDGFSRAGAVLERGLLGAIRRGGLGFEDLRRIALRALDDIAAQAARGLFTTAASGGGLGGLLDLGNLAGSILGLPGRATGGPVTPGRGYLVGERGPELFVPTSAGNIVPAGAAPSREVRVAINVNAPSGAEPQALARSSRQVARAVSRALAQAER
jgi:phage-related minor tail protein